MRGDQLKKQVNEALETLVHAVEQGQSEQLRAYLSMLGRFHRYSVGNVLLIAMQRPTATRVAGFRAWRKLGRQVKQGERAIYILAPIVWRKKGEAARTDAEAEEEVVRFKAACVFDVAQTKGKPLPEFAQVLGEPGEHLARLEEFVVSRGIALRYSQALGGAEGYSTGGAIVMKSGLAPAEGFSVLVHELAHEMLHRGEGSEERSKTLRETEAEAVAFAVCQAVGLDARASSTDYIHLYQGSKETLLESLGRIRQVAAEIIAGIRDKDNTRTKARQGGWQSGDTSDLQTAHAA